MKVIQAIKDWKPITIVLETKEEFEALYAILIWSAMITKETVGFANKNQREQFSQQLHNTLYEIRNK